MRTPRRLSRSFLEVEFFTSFHGRNLIFCIYCSKNLKKVWWWHKKINVNFFRPKYNIFLGYLKNYKPHHFFEKITQKIHRKGWLPGINWNLISKHEIRRNYGFSNRLFTVFHKKQKKYTMILALYQAYSKICFREVFKLITVFFQNLSSKNENILTKMQRKYASRRDVLHFLASESTEMTIF